LRRAKSVMRAYEAARKLKKNMATQTDEVICAMYSRREQKIDAFLELLSHRK